MRNDKGLTLKRRLYAMLACTLLGLVIYGSYSVFQLREHILEQRQLELKALVESSMGVIQHQYDRYVDAGAGAGPGER